MSSEPNRIVKCLIILCLLDTILDNIVWQFYTLFFNSVYSSSQLRRAIDSVSKCSPDTNDSPLPACSLNFQNLFLNDIDVRRTTLLLTTVSNVFFLFSTHPCKTKVQNTQGPAPAHTAAQVGLARGSGHSTQDTALRTRAQGMHSGHAAQDICSGHTFGVRTQGTLRWTGSHTSWPLKFLPNCCTKVRIHHTKASGVSVYKRPKNRLCQRTNV